MANLHISQERGGIAGLNEEFEKVIKWVPQDEPESDRQSSSRKRFREAKKGSTSTARKRFTGSYTRKWKERATTMAAIKNKQANGGGTWEFERGNLVGNIAKPIADIGASVCAMGRTRRGTMLCAFCSVQGDSGQH